MSEHLTPEQSDRGFLRLPPIPGGYGGSVVVYESSAATAPHVWLKASPDTLMGPSAVAIALHLTVEDALKLADQLRWLVEHHYQGTTPWGHGIEEET